MDLREDVYRREQGADIHRLIRHDVQHQVISYSQRYDEARSMTLGS